jgi:peptidyl-prolyl cis-trans isomerase SurA
MIKTKVNIICTKSLIFLILLCVIAKASESFIAVKVDNEIITNYDIQQEVKYLTVLNNDLNKLDNSQILKVSRESLIREKIKTNEILKHFVLNKSDDLVNDFLKSFYTKLNFESEIAFANYLEGFDLELGDIKNKFEIEMLWNELIKKKFSKKININKDFLKEKITNEKLSEKSLIQYDLSEILFKTNNMNDFTSMNDAIKNDIEINGFKNAANIYSISDTAKFGGEIGWVNESQLSKNIVNLIKALEVNEISEAIETQGGYLILKINDKKKENVQIDEEVILKNLINYELQRQYNQFSRVYYNKIKLNSQISE